MKIKCSQCGKQIELNKSISGMCYLCREEELNEIAEALYWNEFHGLGDSKQSYRLRDRQEHLEYLKEKTK